MKKEIDISKYTIGIDPYDKQDLEKEVFELEQQLDIPSHLRWHNCKTQQKRSYSKKELKEAFMVGHNICRCITDNRDEAKEYFKEWFNKFKIR